MSEMNDEKNTVQKPPQAPSQTPMQQSPGQPPQAPGMLATIAKMRESIFDKWVPSEGDDTFSWDNDLSRAYVEQEPLKVHLLLYGLILTVIALIIWAALAEIDEVTKGEAKVIPSQQVQIIQSQDGGVVKQILIKEGDIVEKGQLLVTLDQTRSTSSLRETEVELMAMRAKAQRLSAVAEGRKYEPSADLLEKIPAIVRQEQALYKSNIEQLQAAKAIADEQLTQRREELSELKARNEQVTKTLIITRKELELTEPLTKSGAVSAVELLRLEREVAQHSGDLKQTKAQIQRSLSAIAEAEGNLKEVELVFYKDIREELTATIAKVNGLEESSTGLTDRVDQTLVKSPVRGTVKRLYYNTVGGVVLPGKEIVEIVPLDDSLLLEARVQPRDIAFLRPGQAAMVKFTAYDFVVYGGLDGTVETIGADTIIDEKGNAFYIVKVRTHETTLGADMPIIPGMVAEVDILTGKKTILAYLMKPVLRAKQYALTER